MTFNCKMHERNIYRNRPDFEQIALDYPSFRKYAITNAKGKVRVDFTNTDALRMLTTILLKKDFNLDVVIPEGYLIPTIPQRLNYILWVEDILAKIPKLKESIIGVDIGTGPCAIFSLLGAKKNNWNFIATETSDEAIKWAQNNIEQNNLISNIKVIKVNQDSAFNEILSSSEKCYEFSLCNPPFFENPEEIRKKHQNTNETIADTAQAEEIFFKGGEIEFVRNMLKESLIFKNRIRLYTSMFGKKNSYLQILKELKEIEDVKFTSTEFCQGNTVRWGIAWTFDKSIQFEEFKEKKKPKHKKSKPLEFEIPVNSKDYDLLKVLQRTRDILKNLEIPVTTTKSSKTFAELLLKSDRNTWTHQRRKRREIERQKKISNKDVPCGGSVSSEMDKTSLKLVDIDSKTISREVNNICPEKDSLENPRVKLEMSEKLDWAHIKPLASDSEKANKSSHSIKIEPRENETFVKSEASFCENKSLQSSNVVKKLLHVTDNDTTCFTLKNEANVPLVKIEANSSSVVNEVLCENEEMSDCVKRKRKEDLSLDDSVESKKIKLDVGNENESKSMDQGTILNCQLHFFKGKNKIYAKMNCSETADRNTMYQVFQLIKNKLQ